MQFSHFTLILLVSALGAEAQFTEGTYTAVVGGTSSNLSLLGNYYNYWVQATSSLWDLTRSAREPSPTTYTIPCNGARKSIVIEPTRSALVIIDMQNFFLHPGLTPKATAGRGVVNATVNMIQGFRRAGVKVLWTNWGLDNYDLLTMPPAFLDGFSNNHSSTTTFGTDMGVVPGTNISAGLKLMRGSWNARPYGPLYDLQVEGVKSGTDLYFNKNRLSGLWGAQTPLGLWLQENEITTLFFGGVNADQCVWGTFLDAYYKGFDVVYVEDISATTSPYYATQMVTYNANLDGFLSNSTQILSAIK
ncbi:Peroxyureidoacrylate/ureidoacrylate amidohydrolase [Lachnellula suecica]|uniref:Peroxyureidoacrylate/ureidoacrylate amidohydrolase n=1 Tax=Lachnellula suecica TaxID=602035 RepID=A0A8T9C198_9HELO|nr:Peroxyureidoacrylate/ureidoacrylate amidohydrolase [Lachnellula suecica]